MLNIIDKINGQKVQDYQYNSPKNNILDAINSTGQTPVTDSGSPDSNTQQLSIAMAIYGAGGMFYIDSGSANNYVLSVQTISGTAMRAPNVYFNGMKCTFTANNSNTGTSTVNVAGLGVKTIKKNNYTGNLDANDIRSGYMYHLIYSYSTGFFELKPVVSMDDLPIIGAQGSIIQKGASYWGPLAIGTAGQLLRVNSGATALEYYSGINFVNTNLINNQTFPLSWTDVDLSSVVGSNYALVYVKIIAVGGVLDATFRYNGDSGNLGRSQTNNFGGGITGTTMDNGNFAYLWLRTDSAGIVEATRGLNGTSSNYSLDIIAYIK